MSLRSRLTLLYTSLVGGILLVFGFVVYQLVSVNLVDQIDELLAISANDLIEGTELNAVGGLDMISTPDVELATNVYFQLWARNQGLSLASASISHLREPMSPLDYLPAQPVYRTTTIGGAPLRVLSVPLSVGNRLIGTLQVGASTAIVEATQKNIADRIDCGDSRRHGAGCPGCFVDHLSGAGLPGACNQCGVANYPRR